MKHDRQCDACGEQFFTSKAHQQRCHDCTLPRIEYSEEEKNQIQNDGLKYCYATEGIRASTGCKGSEELQPLENFEFKKTSGFYTPMCKKCRGERTWRKNTFRDYKITYVDYYNMEKAQGGRCLICRSDFKGKGGKYGVRDRWSIDHWHNHLGLTDHGKLRHEGITNTVRGLTCSTCNGIMGTLSDNPNTFLRAFLYLKIWDILFLDEAIADENNIRPDYERFLNLEYGEIIQEKIHAFIQEGVDFFTDGGQGDIETFYGLIEQTGKTVKGKRIN